MFDFEKPKIEIAEISEDKRYGKFVVEPLERGYGTTLGNSLRRIMLSSLPGAAVSQVKIDGVLHEFSSIPGVKEDVTEIIMNIKSLAIKNSSETNEPKTAYIEFEGEGVITAADIHADSDIEILNPDQVIATLSGGADSKFYMELTITKGRGYISADKNKSEDLPIGVLAVDSIYTPVERVNMTVENTRVGQVTDYDKLTLDKFKDEKILIKEKQECIYIYREIMDGRAQTGLVACVSVDDNINGVIKIHEYTKPDKELDRTNHIKYCNANTGTILLTYKNREKVDEIIDYYVKNELPIYDFISDDGIFHTVWRIDRKEDLKELVDEFDKIPHLYIADGHHRSASAVNVAKEKRDANPNYTGDEEFNYYIAMIAPENDLEVMDYNRVVKDLNGNTKEEFLDKIAEKFDVEKVKGNTPYKPQKKGDVGMFLDGDWYRIEFGKRYTKVRDEVKSLDISILQDNILDNILGIKDPRRDKRIDFVGGIRGIGELERRVNNDMKVAFAMYPTGIEELIAVADANKIMPAKSTWFEPKVRCGLFLHELD